MELRHLKDVKGYPGAIEALRESIKALRTDAERRHRLLELCDKIDATQRKLDNVIASVPKKQPKRPAPTPPRQTSFTEAAVRTTVDVAVGTPVQDCIEGVDVLLDTVTEIFDKRPERKDRKTLTGQVAESAVDIIRSIFD